MYNQEMPFKYWKNVRRCYYDTKRMLKEVLWYEFPQLPQPSPLTLLPSSGLSAASGARLPHTSSLYPSVPVKVPPPFLGPPISPQ